MRLDKYIATHSEATRSIAKSIIKSGRVKVNHAIEKDPGSKVSMDDEIIVNGNKIDPSSEVYIALYKPTGILSSTENDEEYDTVVDLVDGYTHKKLHIAGRLDKDTTGLVLLTSDGQWSHRVTSPKFRCKKTYLVTLADPIHDDIVDIFKSGIVLRGEDKPTLPAELEILDHSKCRITIVEGKYHQVKRMFGAIGNKVVSLKREKMGCVTLENLNPGEFYPLDKNQIKSFLV